MIKFSKNKKLNGLLNDLYDSINDKEFDEIKHYYDEFQYEPDYNYVQYGNLLIYYYDIRKLYQSHGYKSLEKYSDDKVWETYKRQVGYIIRYIIQHAN